MRKCAILICLLSLGICFASGKTRYDFRNEKDAADQIAEDIQSKRLVFLNENHTDVAPVYFLTKNLEKFYNAGLRYIFLEEQSDNYINNPQSLAVHLLPAWGTWAQKYEYLLFENAIMQLNQNHKDDPLIPVWPEAGLIITDEDMAGSFNHVMNMRDSYAQKNIISIMDNTDKKGLIFYGGAHGQKKPMTRDEDAKEPEWKMIGSYMDDHYANDFSTYILEPFDSNEKRDVIYKDEGECKIIPQEILARWTKEEDFIQEYNYYGAYKHEIQGVPNCYIPEKNILNFMISLFDNSEVSEQKEITLYSKKSEQLFAIYYLKYHLGDTFAFDYTCSKAELYEALAQLKHSDLQSLPYDLAGLVNYMECMYASGWLEDYLFNPANDERIGSVLYDMARAEKLNTRDIWPCYWTAYFETEKASYSGKKSDYKKALAAWEKLLQNDLVYASPVIKLVYHKAAACEEKLSDKGKVAFYQEKENAVNPLVDIDFEKYVYFGK